MSEIQSNFMGLDGFIWFVGVVEDRNDPDQLGRVRVRCLGFHTDDLIALPTADLPWAHVMHPVTDPSMHGMGNSPSFLIEGSWVVGFFRDSKEKQQPLIIGTIPGVPKSSANPIKGFNDPRHQDSTQLNDGGLKQYAKQIEKDGDTSNPTYGPYPLGASEDLPEEEESGVFSRGSGHTYGEADTSRLARGSVSETHGALVKRRARRVVDIPIATKPFLSRVQDGATAETRGTFSEPNPKGIASDASPYTSATYPLNHVYESEAGHIFEIDDTSGGERLHREHSSGTFEEIHPTGTRVVKIIGDNYEIIAGNSNVFIGASKGSGDVLNLTINGNVRELIKGDYILEVEGDFTQKIGKNFRTKVGYKDGGNREEEIKGNYGYTIDDNIKGRVGVNVDVIIGSNEIRTVNGTSQLSTEGFYFINSNASIYILAKTNLSASTTSGIMSFKSGDKLNMKSAKAMDIKTEADGLTIYSEGLVTETFKASQITNITGSLTSTTTTTWTHTSGGNIVITGGPNIDLNP
jgi:hypothetical protein